MGEGGVQVKPQPYQQIIANVMRRSAKRKIKITVWDECHPHKCEIVPQLESRK